MTNRMGNDGKVATITVYNIDLKDVEDIHLEFVDVVLQNLCDCGNDVGALYAIEAIERRVRQYKRKIIERGR